MIRGAFTIGVDQEEGRRGMDATRPGGYVTYAEAARQRCPCAIYTRPPHLNGINLHALNEPRPSFGTVQACGMRRPGNERTASVCGKARVLLEGLSAKGKALSLVVSQIVQMIVTQKVCTFLNSL